MPKPTLDCLATSEMLKSYRHILTPGNEDSLVITPLSETFFGQRMSALMTQLIESQTKEPNLKQLVQVAKDRFLAGQYVFMHSILQQVTLINPACLTLMAVTKNPSAKTNEKTIQIIIAEKKLTIEQVEFMFHLLAELAMLRNEIFQRRATTHSHCTFFNEVASVIMEKDTQRPPKKTTRQAKQRSKSATAGSKRPAPTSSLLSSIYIKPTNKKSVHIATNASHGISYVSKSRVTPR